MMRNLLSIILLVFSFNMNGQKSPYLLNESYTYSDLIQVYQSLDKEHVNLKMIEAGKADVGKPIHLIIIDKHQEFNPKKARLRNKTILLINNGIHAGEACGVDASVEFAKKILDVNNPLSKALDSVVVVIVPVYNVGGMLNRGAYSRANQNGPREHGFRGNAQNLDLNRDFIKVDSRNAQTFTAFFRAWDPDIFIDTHTTNGSDHQYTLTLIATQKDKQNSVLSEFAQKQMIPAFYKGMSEKYMDMIPYVYSVSSSPDKGIKAFLETPRYSSGYASLFDCFSFITEAHVFKTFENRVKHTQGFLETVLNYTASNSNSIRTVRRTAKKHTIAQQVFPIQWKLDTNNSKRLDFNGYAIKEQKSEVTGQKMKFYDTNQSFTTQIDYFETYVPVVEVKKPTYYIIPQAYSEVIERLTWNKVEFQKINADTLMEVETYRVEAYKSPKTPYEGHFLHSNISVSKTMEQIRFYAGDILVETNQEANRYIVETLEPQSVDGFFAWNFFEGILQQKEWFSDYAFEPIAKELLNNDKKLRMEFDKKKSADSDFAENSWAQLYFIYKRSPYYERTVNRFPVYRLSDSKDPN